MFVRRSRAFSLILSVALLIGLIYVYITVPGPDGWINSWQTMDSPRYVKDLLHDKVYGADQSRPAWDGKQADKIIVMARLPHEDTSWVERELPDWQRAIYTVPNNTVVSQLPPPANRPPTEFILPANKGHESMAYLTYIIDHYDFLPAIVLFLHSHEAGYHEAWHVDARLHSNVVATRELRLPVVSQRGYVNMRCHPRSNCLHLPHNFHPKMMPIEVWRAYWAGTSTPESAINAMLLQRSNIDEADPEGGPTDLGTDPYPPIADPSGAQFAVTRDAIRARPRTDYVALREWLVSTDLGDYQSGRVFEYNWHVLFGMPGVLCYDRKQCDCEAFGRCD